MAMYYGDENGKAQEIVVVGMQGPAGPQGEGADAIVLINNGYWELQKQGNRMYLKTSENGVSAVLNFSLTPIPPGVTQEIDVSLNNKIEIPSEYWPKDTITGPTYVLRVYGDTAAGKAAGFFVIRFLISPQGTITAKGFCVNIGDEITRKDSVSLENGIELANWLIK